MAENDGTAHTAPGPDLLSSAPVTQPFPRSPKTQRKAAAATAEYTQEQLSGLLEELENDSRKTEARMASLKKRHVNLTVSAGDIEQQVRERFDGMRLALEKDEQAVLAMLEQDHRENSSKLTRFLQDWTQHHRLVRKHIGSIRKLQENSSDSNQPVSAEDFSCQKKPDAAEEAIKLNEEKFQKLMKALGKISKELEAQLQRKRLLLDSTGVVIDRTTSHRQIKVSPRGHVLHISAEDSSAPHHPQQFDQVYCALGSVPITAGQHYWEVDVHCCSDWAVGVAYGSLNRKGQDKSTKLGRNRMSWCLEFKDGHLSAWHNDRHVALSGRAGRGAPDRVGVYVNYQKGRVVFYDAETVKVLQEFSAASTAVFERAYHQFTEPLFPAFRFFKARDGQSVSDHIEICDL
ncbi:tripartite motif-containing protein 14 [Astyanax mexicanus]|uniref:tripartite motif-containing protein 14 n=1 Tax=Astyanax mexicanus TaxID=7994 RepID=UPI0020CAA638|nr:tripartite motif-containing protein 14 [Astyanax mexicanus]